MKSRLYRIWRRFLFSRKGYLFAFLYNLSYGYRNRSPVFFKQNNLFIPTNFSEKKKSIYFGRPRNLLRYRKGAKRRLKFLFQEYLLDLVPVNDGDVVIDVGANIGEIGLCYQLIHKRDIRYISVEPEKLENHACALNNPRQINISGVLWKDNKKKKIKLFHGPEGVDTSAIKAEMHHSESLCDVYTIESIFEIYSISAVKLLKLEAEGAEPEVIQGAKAVLSNIEYIAADLGPERGYVQECTVEAVTNFLLQNGFELLKVHYPGRLNCLYRNRKQSHSEWDEHQLPAGQK